MCAQWWWRGFGLHSIVAMVSVGERLAEFEAAHRCSCWFKLGLTPGSIPHWLESRWGLQRIIALGSPKKGHLFILNRTVEAVEGHSQAMDIF